jgi:hypothetical protein
MQNLENLHKLSYNNRAEMKASKFAGCFHCLRKFDVKKITSYALGRHAECPYCKKDTVIGDHVLQGKFSIKMDLNKQDFKQLNEFYETSFPLNHESKFFEEESEESMSLNEEITIN